MSCLFTSSFADKEMNRQEMVSMRSRNTDTKRFENKSQNVFEEKKMKRNKNINKILKRKNKKLESEKWSHINYES